MDLFHDLPAWDVEAAAHLIAAYAEDFPPASVFCCVVDPGVGSNRSAVILRADSRWFTGPDNGLLSRVAKAAKKMDLWDIVWRPERLSASFHGRDLFSPVAARLATDGEAAADRMGQARDPDTLVGLTWPNEAARIIYIDGFGNAMTGLRAQSLAQSTSLGVKNIWLERARTFSDMAPGALFWYENANGLAEISQNQACAAKTLGLRVGDPVKFGSENTNS